MPPPSPVCILSLAPETHRVAPGPGQDRIASLAIGSEAVSVVELPHTSVELAARHLAEHACLRPGLREQAVTHLLRV